MSEGEVVCLVLCDGNFTDWVGFTPAVLGVFLRRRRDQCFEETEPSAPVEVLWSSGMSTMVGVLIANGKCWIFQLWQSRQGRGRNHFSLVV